MFSSAATMPLVTRYGRSAVRRLISQRTVFRGRWARDGRVTLVTVNYGHADDTLRLVRSFRSFVSDSWPVVVVENRTWRDRRYIDKNISATVLGGLINLHHGLGLDWGLRKAETEYVLVCDPDSIILSGSFWARIQPLVDEFGIASVDNGATQYHPMCLAFRTEIWKRQALSMEQRWSENWDVAGALTPHFGGLNGAALLRRTDFAGPAVASSRAGVHYPAEIYEGIFSCISGASRAVAGEGINEFAWSEQDVLAYHKRWRAWADRVVDGAATVASFPH